MTLNAPVAIADDKLDDVGDALRRAGLRLTAVVPSSCYASSFAYYGTDRVFKHSLEVTLVLRQEKDFPLIRVRFTGDFSMFATRDSRFPTPKRRIPRKKDTYSKFCFF